MGTAKEIRLYLRGEETDFETIKPTMVVSRFLFPGFQRKFALICITENFQKITLVATLALSLLLLSSWAHFCFATANLILMEMYTYFYFTLWPFVIATDQLSKSRQFQ